MNVDLLVVVTAIGQLFSSWLLAVDSRDDRSSTMHLFDHAIIGALIY
jgi:hypothetical protein